MNNGNMVPLEEWVDSPSEVSPDVAWAGQKRVGLVEGLILAVPVLLSLAILCSASLRSYLRIPYADAHDWAAELFRGERTGAWLTYFWTPHNAQRMPWARLAELVEVDGVRGRLPSFLILSAVTWTAGVLALVVIISKAEMENRVKIWIGVMAGLIMSDVALGEDFAFPVSSVYLFSAGPALASACTFAMSDARGLRSLSYWVAIVFAVMASWGVGAGLAIWPALLIVALMVHRSKAEVSVLTAAAIICVVVSEAGLGTPSTSMGRGGDDAGKHIIKMVIYFGNFCGLPWSRTLHSPLLGSVLGWSGIILALRLVRQAWRKRHDHLTVLTAAAMVLVLFSLATAFLAAVGRVDELPAPIVPTRYTPFAALLQIGLVIGSASFIQQNIRRAYRRSILAMIVFASLILAADWRGARLLILTTDRIRSASERFDQGFVSRDVEIHPVPSVARAIRLQLRLRGLPS